MDRASTDTTSPESPAVAPKLPSTPLPGSTLRIDSATTTPADRSTSTDTLTQQQWDRLSGQRDVMIKAMVRVFTWLNGGVFGFTLLAWGVGIFIPSYRIVDHQTLMALVAATVVQAGIAFIAITRFLFPTPKDDASS